MRLAGTQGQATRARRGAGALSVLLLVAIAACTPKPPLEGPITGPPASNSALVAAPATTSASTTTSTPPTASARPPMSPLDVCRRDDECVADMTTTEGEFACCSGCGTRAISKAALAAFRDACAQKPPPSCPPLGCVSPITHAVCEGARCVLKPGEASPRAAAGGPHDCDPGGPPPRTCVPPARTRGGPPGPGGCREEPEGGVCRGCRPRFDRLEGGRCCYTGLSRFPKCER